jgi:hypothetical protein
VSQGPDLSFVLVTDSFERIARTVDHVRAQSRHESIELVLVTPTGTELDVDRPELHDFWGVEVVEVPSIESLSSARVPGARRAHAPLVALGETHSFPQAGWAEALLAAHAAEWDAVGPGIINANPSTMLSWSNLFLDYGIWIEPTEPTEMEDLPGHNSSYRKAVLAHYADGELMRLFEAETMLHLDLRRRGHRLLLEPGARLAHTNVTRWASTFRERFAAGQRFAAARAQHFSIGRRLVYAFGSPLIPFIRFPRILRDMERCGRRGELMPQILPSLCTCLVISALGELWGYLAGSGSSMQHLSRIELDKLPHLRRGDSLVDATA